VWCLWGNLPEGKRETDKQGGEKDSWICSKVDSQDATSSNCFDTSRIGVILSAIRTAFGVLRKLMIRAERYGGFLVDSVPPFKIGAADTLFTGETDMRPRKQH
jgi:hypothetical protein